MKKCYFCEHERGLLDSRINPCLFCHNFDNFQLKNRMSPRQAWEYSQLERDEEWVNDRSVEFDRDTASMVLKDLLTRMSSSTDNFGRGTMTISSYAFELVMRKYLDEKG